MRYQNSGERPGRSDLLVLSLAMVVALICFSACGEASPSAHVGASTPTAHAATVPVAPIPQPSATAGTTVGSGDDGDLATLHAMSRSMQGPDGWTWRASLPDHRLVVFYGNPLSAVMGPIGQYSDADLIAKLHEQAQAYDNLDPAHPTVPALDYVDPVVQPVAMDDGSWVYRMPTESVEHYINVANSNHALFFFDMQIGHSTVQKEVNLVWSYLQRPGVDLALDPEFDMPPGAIPDQVFGRMTAAEINWTIDQLSDLVLTRHLPSKVLIIHQFLQEMLPDWQNIKVKPGVQVVTCVDGFGPPGEKIDDYRTFDRDQLIQYPGMKMFYKLDKPLMPPEDVLALKPAPLMVMYQ